MNLDGIRVNHAALDQAAGDMRQKVKEIDDRLDRLERELEPLKSDWAGHAQTSYQTAKAKWNTAIAEMRDLLTEAHLSVNQSNADYAAADRRGASTFGG